MTRTSSGRLQRVSRDGRLETEWKGVGETARPEALAVGPSGNLYVGDSFNGRVDRSSLDGAHLGMVLGAEIGGRKPRIDANGAGSDDRLVVADEAEQRLILVGADGTVQTVTAVSLGLGERPGFGAVAFDPSGAVLVTVKDEARVLRLRLG